MRTVPSGLLQSQTRCLAVMVVLSNGTVYGLTDGNIPITFTAPANAGSLTVTYKPINGFNASNIEQEAGVSPRDLQVTTVEGMVASQISRGDLLQGRYQGARVWVFEVDWLNLSNGALIKGQYVVGKATIKDTSIEITLKETLYLLRQATGRIVSATCDVEQTFNLRCDPSQTLLALNTFPRTVTAVSDQFTIDFGSDTKPLGFYNFGWLTWTSGQNEGLSQTIKVHLTPGGDVARILLSVPMEAPVEVGDQANLVRGCDRTIGVCKTISNSANPSTTNVENFQGMPFIPVPDSLNVVGRQSGM